MSGYSHLSRSGWQIIEADHCAGVSRSMSQALAAALARLLNGGIDIAASVCG